ncbi:MAG TPA: MBOAT family protein, partial [Casimicrobiaceae bacterium]
MLFPTVTFAVFFAIVLPVSWAMMRAPRAWRAFILLASYVFYGWWDWHFVFLLAASTVVNHVLAVAMFRARGVGARKALLALAVAFDLGLLAYFKYTNFFLSSADNLFGTSWLTNVTLPVGVSFYTFMAISYVVDTYRGELAPASFGRFAVFQAFFPHLVAGPIVRASELLPQLEEPRDPRRVDTSRAF